MRQGTLGYIAPELLGLIDGGCSPAADMWSLGWVIYRVLAGREFLRDVDEVRKYVNGQTRFPLSDLRGVGLSEGGIDFLQKLLKVNPGSRISAANALRHCWPQAAAQDTLPVPEDAGPEPPSSDSALIPIMGPKPESSARQEDSTIPSTAWSWTDSNFPANWMEPPRQDANPPEPSTIPSAEWTWNSLSNAHEGTDVSKK